jgi:site-specific DNA-methyltransferase (adenine-specific)
MKDTWQTPQHVYDWLDKQFHFELDAACTIENCKCAYGIFYNQNHDALVEDWTHDTSNAFDFYYKNIWLNPPYSRGNLPRFMEKAYQESLKGATIVCLVPLDITSWVRNFVIGKSEVWIPDERICFIDPDTGLPGESPSKGNMIVIYGPKANLGSTRFVHIPK